MNFLYDGLAVYAYDKDTKLTLVNSEGVWEISDENFFDIEESLKDEAVSISLEEAIKITGQDPNETIVDYKNEANFEM